MSLAPREQERLTAIENQLRATDPRFAAMFRMLGGLNHRRKAPVWVSMSVWVARRGGAKLIILLAAILAFLVIACVAGSVMEASNPAWPARVIHSTDVWGTGGYR